MKEHQLVIDHLTMENHWRK